MFGLCRDMTEDDVVCIISNGHLTLTLVSKDHEGEWRCQATNSLGSSEAKARLTVRPGGGNATNVHTCAQMCANARMRIHTHTHTHTHIHTHKHTHTYTHTQQQQQERQQQQQQILLNENFITNIIMVIALLESITNVCATVPRAGHCIFVSYLCLY